MTNLTAFLLLVACALLGRFVMLPSLTFRATGLLSRRLVPVVIGLITAAFMAWSWGGLDQVAVIHDEAAYLLQAKIYASGHWTAPGRPLPEFFEQYHVFVTPILMSKYPPGHAILLVPGIWIGLPGLMPVLLLGLCGALVFEVSRRLTNPWVGLIAWFLWLTAPGVMIFDPGYLSETSSSALWMLGWYALLRWIDDDRSRWLTLLSLSIGLGFLSRPVTMVLFAIPVAIVVLVRTKRTNNWRALRAPSAIGILFLALWSLWCERTTGSPFAAPYALYSRYYFPDDVMGFGLTGLKPLRALNPDMVLFNESVKSIHRDYTLAALPRHLVERIAAIAAGMWLSRMMYGLLAAVGLLTAGVPLRFALVTSELLVLGYLCVGHPSGWIAYYLEIQPVLAFATAAGWWRVVSLLSSRKFRWSLHHFPEVAPGPVLAMILSALLLFPYTVSAVNPIRIKRIESTSYQRDFRHLLRLIPDAHSMVFIRYAPGHSPHMSLVTNEPDLAKARVWTVYDLGAHDTTLMRLDPKRTPYLFDDEHRVLVPLDSMGVPHYEHLIREPGTRN